MTKAFMLVPATLVAIVAAQPGPGEEDAKRRDRPFPLTELAVVGGAAQVEPTEEGYIVRNTGRIRGRVAMPPDAYPCRLAPAENLDVVQLRIGRVESLLANAMYSPETDLAVEFLGDKVVLSRDQKGYVLNAEGPLKVNVIPDFMKTQRGVKWYKPITHSAFKRAPAGWCSWYIYWQGVTEEEVVKNTD
ncbi:MAG: hypothetical protein H5T86_15130, partial [Armatimonadetes bacterium]|nr:hypothetical protein [Armatimonadota bacterium]